MSDESYSFSTARARLEEIVVQVRKKDTSLEKSLDLLEEGVRLANVCTELIDRADWTVGGVADATGTADSVEDPDDVVAGEQSAAPAADDATAADSADEALAEAGAPVVETEPEAQARDQEDDGLGDAADEAWADDTPEYADHED